MCVFIREVTSPDDLVCLYIRYTIRFGERQSLPGALFPLNLKRPVINLDVVCPKSGQTLFQLAESNKATLNLLAKFDIMEVCQP